MKIDWEPLRPILEEGEKFILTSHVRPDADALGSELGLAAILEDAGKSVAIVNPSAAPGHLDFLDADGVVHKLGETIDANRVEDADVHIVIDTSAWTQLGDLGTILRRTSAKKVVIDHHVSSDDIGAVEFKDVSAEASGVLVVELADALGFELPKRAAVPLFAAIATDTGWFRFPSTKPSTYETIARLVALGARPEYVYRMLYERKSVGRLRLAGRVLGRIEFAADGRIAYTWVTQADFKDLGAQQADTEDLVNECLTLDGTEAAFIAIEQENGSIKVSLRSRTGLNVAAVAEKFGGGGHRQAAGTVLPGPVDAAVKKALAALLEAVDQKA
ncbi:DHH family phosphoesterase [Stratiformator vulcanicus]|uniref:NanoRNase/pAp phosphatase n=1 Tax=Stratiformator vulcanicus TaxID=2527980 RepID=A0A517R2W4_9PLAN|nr:bifunctional oligoribonuclease/PAP phosphatase NrnA [Stratiformator vulcanicus]QDT38183.1 NanoRNase/pAp phosphatase [Stratiformator vulcanicus]